MALLKSSRFPGMLALALMASSLALASVSPPPARPRTVATPQEIYAAFTLNLTRFITWPESAFESPTAPFIIGTFPRDAINDELDAAVAGEKANGRPIRVIRLLSLDDVRRCHLIFMSRNQGRQAAVLERCAGKPILTIGDSDSFLELGGHVRFVQRPPHIKPSISQANLKSSGLEARAQLLRIAAAP